MNKRYRFLEVIRKAIGAPYTWGGQCIEKGFDCSGLIYWGLNEIGFEVPDLTASHYIRYFNNCIINKNDSKPGDIWFYGINKESINHIMVVLSKWPNDTYILCGARGGTYLTQNENAASNDRAFVDVCFGDYWNVNFQVAVNPFKLRENNNE